MYTGTCSGNSNDPDLMRLLRFLGAAAGTGGGGYAGYLLTSQEEIVFIILAAIAGASLGNKIGSAIGHGIYSAGSKAIAFFRNSTSVEHQNLLAESQDPELEANIDAPQANTSELSQVRVTQTL